MSASGMLFLDIETVSIVSEFDKLSDTMQDFWTKKARTWLSGDAKKDVAAVSQMYQDKAAIFAEFGKIICISIGYVHYDNQAETSTFRLKSCYGDDEKAVLTEFFNIINKSFNRQDYHRFCGHNIKEFDIPYICRRAVINQLPLPDILNVAGKKPWEVKHFVDTLEEWKYGDFKNYTSLALLAEILGLPTPKDDIDGSMVGNIYWNEGNLDRIRAYCQKDVVTVARIFHKMRLIDFPAGDNIVVSD